jgi:poly(hydroxyalkanoate) granule-associated protein
VVKKVRKSVESTFESAAQQASAMFDKHMAANVKESAHQIWLAGMGAFGRAQAEGGKVFETLIKEGMSLQRKTQGIAEDKIQEVTGRMTSMAGDVQARAGQQWDKLETIFEQRTARAMSRLGVPTAKDVEALIQRVDELAAAVASLSGQPVKPTRARKTAAQPAKAAPEPKAATRASRAAKTVKPTKAAAPAQPSASRKRKPASA